VSAEIAHNLRSTERTRAALRARIVLALGPLTVLAGVVWALVQPWRMTLLHPHGQGFWWLFSEPPLYVVLVGVLFRVVVARGLVEDLEQ
jgi:uncharacterized membrane protein